jgi:hypothetical protein
MMPLRRGRLRNLALRKRPSALEVAALERLDCLLELGHCLHASAIVEPTGGGQHKSSARISEEGGNKMPTEARMSA